MLLAHRAHGSAAFVVARRRKAPLLPPAQHGGRAICRRSQHAAQAAIAALHADAPMAEETDWVQIVEWYDELVRLTDSPVVRLNRAVAVGEADGPRAGLAALAELDLTLPRHTRLRRTSTSVTVTG